MQKRMLPLKSIRPHLYGTRRLEAGDEYEAPVEEAIALVASRKADFAKARKPGPAAPPSWKVERAVSGEPPPPSLDALRLEATQLGINVDGRWGVHRLQHEIDEAKSR